MTTLGRHPDALAVKLTLGDGAHLVASTVNGWAGPVTLHYGLKTGDPVISDVGTVDGDEVSWTLTVADVTARSEYKWARLEDNGVTIAAGPVMTWLGGSGHTATQTIASLTAGPPGPTAVSADADNVATLGTDGLIYVSPADTGGFSDAAVAAFVADETPSATRAAIEALQLEISVAPGESIADALTEAAAGGVVRLQAGTHTLAAPIALTANVSLEGDPGAVLDVSAISAVPAITAQGTQGTPTLLTADAAEGAATITVADATGIAAGDRLKVYSTSTFGFTSQPRGEMVRVLSVAGNTLTLDDPLADSYATADAAAARKITPVENVTIRSLTLVGPSDANTDIVGVHLTRCVGVTIENVTTRNLHTAAVFLTDVVGASVSNCRFTDGLRVGFGYGLGILYASQDVTVTGVIGERVRHAVTIGGGNLGVGVARRVAVSSSSAFGCYDAGFDCHPGGEFVSFVGCHVNGASTDGIVMQGGRFTISGCTVNGSTRYGILVQNLTIRGLAGTVSGNLVSGAGSRGIATVFNTTDARFRVWSGLSVIANNVTDSAFGITMENSSAAFDAEGVSIVGNQIRRVTSSHGIFIRGLLGATVQGNAVYGLTGSSEAIYLYDCIDAAVVGNNVDAAGSSGRAVRLVLSPNATITGNRLKGAATGILTDSGSAPILHSSNVNTCTTPLNLGGSNVTYSVEGHTHGVTGLTATGTKDSTTFLRGDNTWAVPAGGGDTTVQIGTVALPESPTTGLSVSVLADSTTVLPEDVTWDSGGEPTVTDRLLVTFVWSGDDWVGTYGPPIPAPPGPPDATPPTAGTLGITVGTVTADGLVTGASDETALDAAPYSFRVDAGTWSAWQSSASYEWAGLTAETEYDFQHRVRDASGNITEGTVVTDTTNADPPPSGTLTYQGQQRATADVFGDYTYEAPIGTASADRVVLVALTWRAGANRDPGLTINGSSPTLDYSSGSATNGVKFYRATVSSGTTATIVANTGSSYWPSIAVWTTDAAVTLIGASNVEAAGAATSVTVGPISAEDGGFGIAAFRSNNVAAFTTVWSGTNVTERYDSGGTQAASGADINPTGATATITATFDPNIPTPTKVGLARYGWA